MSAYGDGTVLWPGITGGGVSCPVSLASIRLNSITDQVGVGPYSIMLGPAGTMAIVCGFVAGGTNMSLSGVTTIYAYPATGHETFGMGWASSASPLTATAAYTFTGNPQAAVIAGVRTTAVAPVQTAYGTWGAGPGHAVLGVAPTAGNILFGVVVGSTNTTPCTLGPVSGWGMSDGTHGLGFVGEGQANNVHPFGGAAVAVFAGCVGAGWGTNWSYGGSGAASNFFSIALLEWAIT